MSANKTIAIVLILCGVLGLAYGGFSYTKESQHADIGSLHLAVDEHQRINIPLWASIGAIIVGGALLLAPSRK